MSATDTTRKPIPIARSGSRLDAVLFALLSISAAASGQAAMQLDGRLDEPEWRDAKAFAEFRVVEPLTREVPPSATELQVLPLPDALYVAMRLAQSPADRTYGRSSRDATIMDADPAFLMIDFEGLGRTAYEFTVSLSGTQRDSIVINQTSLSTDWDARWAAAVAEDDAGWSVEWRIPWSVAPEGAVAGDKRTIGFYAGRFVKKLGQRYAFPAVELLGPTFVQAFHRIEVQRHSTAALDVVPYVSVGLDRIAESTRGRSGLDLAWRPNGANQLTLAIAPDFGQVESDNLVVNFSAIETFFEDKRPFFTEGQQLFDVRPGRFNRVINTRRVGSAPDAGPEGSSDVAGALKYTGSRGKQEYGLFTALEDDSSEAQGRRYVAARYRWKADAFAIGYLGTWVDRPTRARRATVHTLDGEYRFGEGVSISGNLLFSDIEQSGAASRGFGARAFYAYRPGGQWEYRLSAIYSNPKLDFNDFGFQDRRDLLRFAGEVELFTRSYPAGSRAQSSRWYAGGNAQRTSNGSRLREELGLTRGWLFRSGAELEVSVGGLTAGTDDLISRGNGDVRRAANPRAVADYSSPDTGRLRYRIEGRVEREGERGGYTRSVEFEPALFLTETLRLGLELAIYDSSDWLIWRGGDRFASYERQELDLLATVNWFPSPKHELRAKLQWIALDARRPQDLRATADASLQPAGAFAKDFTLSTLGIQLRYRYEFAPLSDLYVVYSRGGDGSLDDARESFADQLRRTLDNTNADQVFIKIRYRFS